jgi:hypothetical protein
MAFSQLRGCHDQLCTPEINQGSGGKYIRRDWSTHNELCTHKHALWDTQFGKLHGTNRCYRSFTMKSEDFETSTPFETRCLRLRKLGLSILVLPKYMCVHFWYFGLWIWHALSESESSWNCLVFDDRVQSNRVAERSLSIETTWNECYDQETLLGGTKLRRNDYLTLARCHDA